MRPTPEQLALLTRTERVSLAWCDLVNGRPWLKGVTHRFLRQVSSNWVHLCARALVEVTGLEHVRPLRPPGGVLLVANHRSFFDMYVLTMVLFRQTDLLQRVYFPVRAEITRLGQLERALPRAPSPGYDGPCRGTAVPEPPG